MTQVEALIAAKRMEMMKIQKETTRTGLSSDDTIQTPIYYTLPEVKHKYLLGKNSIIQSLPIPKVESVDGHAYVPPLNAIQYVLAFGTLVDFTCPSTMPEDAPEEVKSMWDSTRGRVIAELAFSVPGSDERIVLYLVVWSDDYEPNGTKQSRGSVWILTLSVSPPKEGSGLDNSVVISIGHKSWSHMKLYERFWNDMDHLKNKCEKFYHGGIKQTVAVVATHAMTLRDTPERRSANGVVGGGGTFGLVMDQVVEVSSCQLILPSCNRCWSDRLKNSVSTRSCKVCTDWNIDHPLCTVPANIASKGDMERFKENPDEVGIFVEDNNGNLVVPPDRETFHC